MAPTLSTSPIPRSDVALVNRDDARHSSRAPVRRSWEFPGGVRAPEAEGRPTGAESIMEAVGSCVVPEPWVPKCWLTGSPSLHCGPLLPSRAWLSAASGGFGLSRGFPLFRRVVVAATDTPAFYVRVSASAKSFLHTILIHHRNAESPMSVLGGC